MSKVPAMEGGFKFYRVNPIIQAHINVSACAAHASGVFDPEASLELDRAIVRLESLCSGWAS